MPPYILGIAGPSGSGKSHLSRELKQRLEQGLPKSVSILMEDFYYRQRDDLDLQQRGKINFDHPDALEHTLLIEQLKSLKEERAIEAPQYDYVEHNRKAETISIAPTPIIIVEGILILHVPELRKQLDLSLYVDVPIETCLQRRMRRDTKRRGRTRKSVIKQFESTVEPMFEKFVLPSRAHADLVIPLSNENSRAEEVLASYLANHLF